jgi:hypothetical protein
MRTFLGPVLEITEQHPNGRRLERRLALDRQ